MRFLHTSDIHIGAKQEIAGDISTTFSKIVNVAISEDIHLFLIAGDLFDTNKPSRKNKKFVQEQFKKLADSGIYVCIIPGNHDLELGNPEGLGGEFEEMPNVSVFTRDKGVGRFNYESLNTVVYGKAYNPDTPSESAMVQAENDDAFRVVMAHGSVLGQAREVNYPIKPEHIEQSNAHYVALGDWHSLRNESRGDVIAYYPGSPEMLSTKQKNAGYVIIGEAVGPNLIKTEPRKISTRHTESIEINLGDHQSVEEIKDKILQKADENLVLSVILKGEDINNIGLDTESFKDQLKDNFWSINFKDKSNKAEEKDLEEYPKFMISGQFVEIMQDKIKNAGEEEKELYKEALQTGLRAFKDPDIISD